MKKIMLVFNAIILILLLQSCRDIRPFPEAKPTCSWDKTEQVVFYNLQLMYPAGLSDYHTRLLPYGGIDKFFSDVLVRKGDYAPDPSSANIRINVKSDGTKCIGEKTTNYNSSNYSSGLNGNFIKTPFPSNTAFVGEITVALSSSIYHNTTYSDYGAYYHILWEQTGNNPNGGMAGTMMGKKISYYVRNGAKLIVPEPDNDYYYSGGSKMEL